jgi:hypothetical protein
MDQRTIIARMDAATLRETTGVADGGQASRQPVPVG